MARGKVVYRSRNVKVEFKLNRKGIAACALGPELRASCNRVVRERALPFAVSISPRSDDDHQHYADSWEVDDIVTGVSPESIGRPPMLRVGTRLVNQVRHAAAVEWGNARHPRGHHVLQRTLDHLNSIAHTSN